jgi:hypothetical protein
LERRWSYSSHIFRAKEMPNSWRVSHFLRRDSGPSFVVPEIKLASICLAEQCLLSLRASDLSVLMLDLHFLFQTAYSGVKKLPVDSFSILWHSKGFIHWCCWCCLLAFCSLISECVVICAPADSRNLYGIYG